MTTGQKTGWGIFAAALVVAGLYWNHQQGEEVDACLKQPGTTVYDCAQGDVDSDPSYGPGQ
jgi:hypothetical protein